MRAGAIFDMDGLLFDTELVYNQEWYYIAELYGLKVDPAMLDELRGTNGTRMSEIVNTYWPRVDAKKLTDELFAHAIVTLSKQVPMKPGVVELLEYLKQHAVRMAVASSAPMELIKSNLRLAGIADYFDAVVSGEQVEHGKPFPDIFLLAAQKLNLQAQDCYVFEDGINGVRAYRRAALPLWFRIWCRRQRSFMSNVRVFIQVFMRFYMRCRQIRVRIQSACHIAFSDDCRGL